MDFSNNLVNYVLYRQRSHKIFDPSLELHWIGRGGSDKVDHAPRQTQRDDGWTTKQPSHGDLRILACLSPRVLQMTTRDGSIPSAHATS